MNYWRINSLYKSNLDHMSQKLFLSGITNYLYHREYKTFSFQKDKKVESPDGFSFQLYVTLDNAIFSIYVRNESDWQPHQELEEPQIVKLIEDYFKIHHKQWYLLETLNQEEDLKISEEGRAMTPLEIKQRIDELEINEPMKPGIIEIGKYKNSQTNFYKGSKSEFGSALEFWISCLHWEMEAQINYLDHSNSFDPALGYCMPEDLKAIEGVLTEIKLKDPLSVNPVSALMMREDWNDTIYLVEYEDWFVLYNWFTSE